MISKIMEFKTAIWEKAGKYTAVRGQRMLLSALLGTGLIAWQLLRFAWSLLEVIFVDDKKNKSSSDLPEDVTLDNYALTNYGKKPGESTDIYGRTPGDAFYGSVSFLDPITLEKMNEK